MQLYFLEHWNENKKKRFTLLFDLHKLAVRCLLSKAELLSPLSLALSLSNSLSLSLSLSHTLSLSLSLSLSHSVSFSLSLMWCCGSWLHSIQCNFSDPPCCDVVDKLQWSELVLVCDFSFL